MVEISSHDHGTFFAWVKGVFVPIEGFSWSTSHCLKEGGVVDEGNSFCSTDLGQVCVGVFDSSRDRMSAEGGKNGGGFELGNGENAP